MAGTTCVSGEFIWLGGAAGSGKGTNTPFIAEARDITAPPIVISGLLTSPQAVANKNAAKMVGDREVIGLLFEELLSPQYHEGVIIDGFPRTKVQVECLKMFYNAALELHNEYRSTPLARYFRKPMFRIALLFVEGEVSVERQLKRGREIREHNQRVREAGIGNLREERVTDIDPELCRKRYQTFKDTTYGALESLRKIFHFHFINAEGDLQEVQRNILQEFTYQSSLELSHEVFEIIRDIPIASQLALHARQELVERLEVYEQEYKPLFQKVVRFIEVKLIPIVRAHAISGHARINTEDELLDDPQALRIMIDVSRNAASMPPSTFTAWTCPNGSTRRLGKSFVGPRKFTGSKSATNLRTFAAGINRFVSCQLSVVTGRWGQSSRPAQELRAACDCSRSSRAGYSE